MMSKGSRKLVTGAWGILVSLVALGLICHSLAFWTTIHSLIVGLALFKWGWSLWSGNTESENKAGGR